tara:strand:- start:80 stop:559 length:480 start_codon:yes stop_codon:yes gene_type:complete
MKKKNTLNSRRSTPISDGIGEDLNKLTNLLADHTRGLDAYLKKQGKNIQEREIDLLEETATLQFNSGLDLKSLSKKELQNICRENKLKGWSKLRQKDLISFLKKNIASEANSHSSDEDNLTSSIYPADSNRTERLLILLLRQINTPQEDINTAWFSSSK